MSDEHMVAGANAVLGRNERYVRCLYICWFCVMLGGCLPESPDENQRVAPANKDEGTIPSTDGGTYGGSTAPKTNSARGATGGTARPDMPVSADSPPAPDRLDTAGQADHMDHPIDDANQSDDSGAVMAGGSAPSERSPDAANGDEFGGEVGIEDSMPVHGGTADDDSGIRRPESGGQAIDAMGGARPTTMMRDEQQPPGGYNVGSAEPSTSHAGQSAGAGHSSPPMDENQGGMPDHGGLVADDAKNGTDEDDVQGGQRVDGQPGPLPMCGNAIVEGPSESCDDGNERRGDGCHLCQVEHGWRCRDGHCTTHCGDGIVAGPEACDDGNANQNDACTNACRAAVCGDGFVGPNETCDDGNHQDDDGCSATCQVEAGHGRPSCRAAVFDHSCGSIHIPGPLHFDTSQSDAWTFEVWFKWANDGGADFQHLMFVGRRNGNTLTRRIHLEVINRQGGVVRFREWIRGQEIRAPLTNPSDWHHVAAVSHQGQFVLYLDGEEVGRTAATLPSLDEYGLSIGGVWGRNQGGSCDYAFKGQIAHVRVSDTARYVDDFEPAASWFVDQSTMGQWDLGSIDDAGLPDQSGHHDNAIADRAPASFTNVPAALCRTPDTPCNDACDQSQCGDGIEDDDEECDDGNRHNGDGCSSDCEIQPIVQNGEYVAHDFGAYTALVKRTEVTVAEYRACVQAGICQPPFCDPNQRDYGGLTCNYAHFDDEPVNGITKEDMRTYAQWRGGRLMTMAEFDHLFTNGGTTTYPWGDAPEYSCEIAIRNNGGRCGRDGGTSPVCSRPRGNTPSGICDLAGNARETVEDSQWGRGGDWNLRGVGPKFDHQGHWIYIGFRIIKDNQLADEG